MKTRFIGDVHGKFQQYKKIIAQAGGPTIQVGDMGVGFKVRGADGEDRWSANPPHARMVEDGPHRFIRGNHDNPDVCSRHSQWIPDGTLMTTADNKVMFIGGALSIDKAFRTEGYSWWADEELSDKALWLLVDRFVKERPDIMVTHECPELVAEKLMANVGKLDIPSRTRQAFSSMLSLHQPKLWIFGHWHMSWEGVIDGCKFVCLNELECKDFDI